ncbi:four-carbon acid sugar kinase family protein [Amycolatopsis sp. A133]|uniref:four-carbon acid sugar kinase family protein n=1 Tax=Amycolatopsis sp. A133 TaxID=3064472 RepID=UPI0027E64205|nr:four-carbon acid sugar kinase family protein [Amycolatopsis sp. A133]MDQ7802385.1 four-carbon acid sugar kinase family protein [Amycolatopsis sp. A133]
MPKLLVLGNDLTGSNATGALYARFGLRAVSVNALAVNVGTRHASPPHATRAVREAVELVGGRPAGARHPPDRRALRHRRRVLPLAVTGRLSGGPHAGLPFATKGSLIGGRDGAVARLEHLDTSWPPEGIRMTVPSRRGNSGRRTAANPHRRPGASRTARPPFL